VSIEAVPAWSSNFRCAAYTFTLVPGKAGCSYNTGLHLLGRDVAASADDHLLLAPGKPDVAVFVVPSEVSRAEPTATTGRVRRFGRIDMLLRFPIGKGVIMSVARISEISSTSEKSFEDAVQQGIERATATLRNVRSAWIKEQEVQVEGNRITAYKVIMKVTFVLE
jgi:flavin-binding protein dodecin